MRSYNLEELKILADGDEDFLQEMLKTFIEELPEDIKAMNDAVDNGNALLTYQIAHKMKPNLQIFGLDLTNNVKMLEQWSKSNMKQEEVLPYASQISDTVMLVCKEIKEDYNI